MIINVGSTICSNTFVTLFVTVNIKTYFNDIIVMLLLNCINSIAYICGVLYNDIAQQFKEIIV